MHNNSNGNASRILDIAEIKRYADLQERLVATLREALPVRDWSLLLDFPRMGEINVHDRKWSFTKHGLGVRFVEIETATIVDVDGELVDRPRAISAWRLSQYAESKWKVSVPIHWLHRELERLSKLGVLKRVPDSFLFTIA